MGPSLNLLPPQADSDMMRPVLKRSLYLGAVAAASAWIAGSNSSTGDWPIDAGPAVRSLAHGRIAPYLSAHPIMGPFATLVQAPFAALAGGGALAEYRWASFPCVLAVGVLGLFLAVVARRRGASRPAQALLAGLCLVNPLTFQALQSGHPEELLTAALAVGAVAAAAEARLGWTTILLGLAVASKQWAVIAILPALMALPRQRVRVALGASVIVVALMLPGFLAAPGAFSDVQGNAASAGHLGTPWSVWYSAATVSSETVHAGSKTLTAHLHELPPLISRLSHPLIILLALGVALALALRRGAFKLPGQDAMALLALLALLRCALDPADNLYYHAPLLLALLGWDALAAPRTLPFRGLLGTAIVGLFWKWSANLTASSLATFSAAYTSVALVAALAIGAWLFWDRQPGSRLGRSLPQAIPSSVELIS